MSADTMTERPALRSQDGHLFHPLSDGNAVNFIPGSDVAPFNHLVSSTPYRVNFSRGPDAVLGDLAPGMHEVPDAGRATIADLGRPPTTDRTRTMAVTAEHVRSTLSTYLDAHPEDKEQLAPLTGLLDEVPDVTSRAEFRGHVTAGAVLVNAERQVLHIRHNALGKWLLPGGHVEAEDVTLPGAALRELVEETGLNGEAVTLVHPVPVHIDLHRIPANDAKGEPAHFHADFRFLFRLDRDTEVKLQEEEVGGYAWRAATEIADSTLRDRVLTSLTAA